MWPIASNNPTGGGLDLVERGRHDVGQRASFDPCRDAPRAVRRIDPIMDRPDREVVCVASQVVADVGLPGPVVGQFDAEPDRTPWGPSARPHLGRPLAIREGRVGEGLGARLEVDVVGDGDLGDATLERGRSVDVDGDVAVGRQVRVHVRVERQVARLAVGHALPSGRLAPQRPGCEPWHPPDDPGVR
jgi:hypothetical protein